LFTEHREAPCAAPATHRQGPPTAQPDAGIGAYALTTSPPQVRKHQCLKAKITFYTFNVVAALAVRAQVAIKK
jgi:hypothetical protein